MPDSSWLGAFRGDYVSSKLALDASRSGVGKVVPGSYVIAVLAGGSRIGLKPSISSKLT